MEPKRSWVTKFAIAGRGVISGIRGQDSFFVHFPFAIAVVAMAAFFHVDRWEWAVLGLCITTVFVAELFNSCIESLAKGITTEHHLHIGKALDIASGAVLVASLGAASVGIFILLPKLIAVLS